MITFAYCLITQLPPRLMRNGQVGLFVGTAVLAAIETVAELFFVVHLVFPHG